MKRIGILIIAFCLTFILLIECDQITAEPTDGYLRSSAETSMKSTRTPLEERAKASTVKEGPVPSESSNSTLANAAVESLVQVAIQDLAKRLDIPVDQIKLYEVREVVWSDASMGCPQPGMAYQQVPQDGLLIRLGVDKQMYFYHSGGSQGPFLCEETSRIIPQITPKEDEFVPPPDSEID